VPDAAVDELVVRSAEPREGGRRPVDLTGQEFGPIVVMRRHGSENRHSTWWCRCTVCGRECARNGYQLRHGPKRCPDCGARRPAAGDRVHFQPAKAAPPTPAHVPAVQNRPPSDDSPAAAPTERQRLRQPPHWQVVLGAPIADVVAALRASGCTLRVSAGVLGLSGPLAAGQALRALQQRRSGEVIQFLLAEDMAGAA
jgi:hypothetical protein